MRIDCSGCDHYDQEWEECKCEGDCVTCSRNACRGCPHYSVVPFGDGRYNMNCDLDWRHCDQEEEFSDQYTDLDDRIIEIATGGDPYVRD